MVPFKRIYLGPVFLVGTSMWNSFACNPFQLNNVSIMGAPFRLVYHGFPLVNEFRIDDYTADAVQPMRVHLVFPLHGGGSAKQQQRSIQHFALARD